MTMNAKCEMRPEGMTRITDKQIRQRIIEERDRYKRERDELLAALSEIYNALQTEGWSMQGAWAKRAASAIAKVQP